MKTELLQIGGWTLRRRKPETEAPQPVIFLLHGWTGTEDVMWVFARKIPQDYLVIAPRALFAAPQGFSWVPERHSGFSELGDFAPAVEKLEALRVHLAADSPHDFSRVHLMGFSQGAAVSFAWAAQAKGRIASLASLAGFVPAGIEDLVPQKPYSGLPVFMAHGTQDRTVPIEHMRRGAQSVEKGGAVLTVCEAEVGHRLSAGCMRALGHFYGTLRRQSPYG